jgi:hypothetical protein
LSALVFLETQSRVAGMKNNFRISIAINVLLMGVILWLAHSERALTSTPNSRINAIQTIHSETQTAPITSAAPAFHWSQIESADYATYIANLRRIGCPEQTIRDIIFADVDEAFFVSRREQLKQKQTGEEALRVLNQEEATFIASLLGDEPPRSQLAAAPARIPKILRTKPQPERDLDRPVSMPLVLEQVDSAKLKLNDAQLRTITELRQNFVAEIGGTNQDPNDPSYRQRWQTAQREADDMLVAILGRNFKLNYELQVESQAAPAK